MSAVSDDQISTYEELLERVGECSLNDIRIQNHLRLIFKIIHGFNLPRLRYPDMIRLRTSMKDLRGKYRLENQD